MIKFKKIIQKAAGPSGGGSSLGRLLVGAHQGPAPGQHGGSEVSAASASASAVAEHPATVTEDSYNVDEALAESVLSDIFSTETEAADDAQAAEAAPSDDGATITSEDLDDLFTEQEAEEESLATALDESALTETAAGRDEPPPADTQAPTDEGVSAGEAAGDEQTALLADAADAVAAEDSEGAGVGDDDISGLVDEVAGLQGITDEALSASQETEAVVESQGAEAAEDEQSEQQAEAAPDGEETPEGAEALPSQEPPDESVMADVDRLLSELGQIRLPEEAFRNAGKGDFTQDASRQSPQAEAPPAGPAAEAEPAETEPPSQTAPPDEAAEHTPPDDLDDPFASLTDEERAALFAEDAEAEAMVSEDSDLVGTLSSEIDEALGEAPVSEPEEPEEAEDGIEDGTELEIDLSPEAVGLEEPAEEESEEETEKPGDVDDLLSSLLNEVDKVPLPEEAYQEDFEQPEKVEESDDLSGLLSEGGSDDPSAESDEATAGADESAEAAPAKDATDVDDETPAAVQSTSDEDLSEDDLVSQALEAAFEADIDDGRGAGEEEGDIFEEDAQDATQEEGDDETDRQEDEEAPDEENDDEGTQVGGVDDVLASLQSSMDAARAEDDGEGGSEEEDQIQQEVLSRSKDVEQAVLDELFGDDTEEFTKEIKQELAEVPGSPQDTPADAETAAAPAAAASASAAPAREIPLISRKIRKGLLWTAYQMNRPFLRWLTPALRRQLAILALGMISTGVITLVAALMLLFNAQ